MSKITFRADEDLIAQLEEFDASKSEIMREALRTYLDETSAEPSVESPRSDSVSDETDSLDELVAERVDALVAERLERTFTPRQPQDINVNISVDGADADTEPEASHTEATRDDSERKTDASDGDDQRNTCAQCGETLSPSDVYCPNCGEKASHRVFCECGDELRSDWAFCPSCGRRTPAADVLDNS
ncbi:double zinc ribbon domain-containing protein [Halapricum hydrolyticum]|uniref:Zinc ribbon domain-containing protein n=1 Tax=Halapricum hydrolyticum TaxID=2979991 RepID=A0AAE3ICL4_9EURY|nr:zinc ribbon domain-containing protein [Halapricum hydrolyticum]MCU4719099.1 zinc ribbon domain-containing protein [Halapricum hydrolyticum]MCU4728128.1 zinc ribbon domain-containing protein [Halapricum hydrolyticum]